MKNNVLRNNSGFTILEVLIAALITAILTTAAFRFYTTMHLQSEVQYDVSEMQQLCRTSLYDMRKTLLQAGFKTGTHAPYEVKGDTLAIYYCETQPIDTCIYYLQEFTSAEYLNVPNRPTNRNLYKLMKKVNSDAPAIFADYITNLNYNVVDADEIDISITIMAPRKDDAYNANGGFRLISESEKINIRNVS
jgi:prepilin-type N-terminal cleavage/methylation domain-containing protein